VVDIIQRAREIIGLERDALTDIALSIDHNFVKAVELILQSKGRTVITGMGKSGLVGQKISSTLASVGTPSFFLHPAEAIHGDIGMIAREDVVIAISNSGETEEIVKLIPLIKRFGLKLIAMTGKADSTLGRAADALLYAGVKVEACPWDIVPTSSTTVVMALGDALALILMEKKNFKREDFAAFHPGGSLGRGLFITVEELTHTGDEIPTVRESASMRDVLREISAKKLGLAFVLDSSGRTAGIITDGDIRRAFERDDDALSKTAAQLMHKNPKTVDPKAPGGTAVKLMEDNKITALAVVDDNKTLVGVVHLHDLLKAGVV
jgi:arabinose-5-phosphate isomerase